MKVWRKKSVTWLDGDGRRVKRSTPGAKRHETLSRRYYGTVRRSTGQSTQVPLTFDEATSRTLLMRLQLESDRLEALGITPSNRTAKRKAKAIEPLLKAFERHLASKDATQRHVSQKMKRLRLLLNSIGAKTIDDLKASRISETLSEWRTARFPDSRPNRHAKTISVETCNHYLRHVKSFSRWLWIEGKATEDVLRGLRLLNSKTDRRVKRRALTSEQSKFLLASIRTHGRTYRGQTWRFTPDDRVALYSLAMFTGLRLSEIASLTVDSFNFANRTVTLQAAHSKRRRDDVLPLHGSLAAIMEPWIGPRTGTVFPGNWTGNAVKLLRRDLADADIPYRDRSGHVLDFHALRHTFISSLARNGVTPAIAQRLARHSSITLTMDVYTHVETESLRESLEALPAIQ